MLLLLMGFNKADVKDMRTCALRSLGDCQPRKGALLACNCTNSRGRRPGDVLANDDSAWETRVTGHYGGSDPHAGFRVSTRPLHHMPSA